MKTEHKFYKFRRGWSSSLSKWEYVRLPHGETPKSFFDEMANEYHWSEHFRGIEYRKVKTPPKEWLEKELASLRQTADWKYKLSNDYIEILRSLL